ncbi:helix-turn-helix domain-containing protein [Neolewinella sp.]|uniref:helix-turn-helix domain-containing protein n=1 Tax=Neolewinella sp. TaxID=2993543 RepID=UPI003B527D4C
MSNTHLPTYIRPSAPLSKIVIRYEWIHIDGSRFSCINLLPSFGVGLVFHFWSVGTVNARSKILDGVTVPQCIVLSPLNMPMHGTTLGSSTHLRVIFHPGMMSLLFDRVPMYFFQDHLPDARSELDPGLKDLYDQMEEAPSCFHMIQQLDNYLLEKLKGKCVRRSILPAIMNTYEKRHTRKISVRDVASDLGISQQHLSKLTRVRLGFSAKRTLSVMRFNDTLTTLHKLSDFSLSQTALDLGYHDQAHMTHEFKQFSGFSPAKYIKSQNERAISGQVEDFSSSGLYFDENNI